MMKHSQPSGATKPLLDEASRPGADEIEETAQIARELASTVSTYRREAEWIDNRFEMENEGRNLFLDDYPYGEELIRTRELPSMIAESRRVLRKLSNQEMSAAEAESAFEVAQALIAEVQSILDDCKPIAPYDDEAQ